MSGQSFPMHISDIIPGATGLRIRFPFVSWASQNRFKYPLEAREFLSRCGSAAEAYFVREFCRRPGVSYPTKNRAVSDDVELQLQVGCAGYYIDALVSDRCSSLAVEIDGIGFHHRKPEQVADDYLRARRITAKGHPVIRFTAKETLVDPAECWKQVDAILNAWGNR